MSARDTRGRFGLLILAALFALLLLRVPVAFGLGGLGLALLLIGGFSPLMAPQAILSTLDGFILLAVPLFILMSNVLHLPETKPIAVKFRRRSKTLSETMIRMILPRIPTLPSMRRVMMHSHTLQGCRSGKLSHNPGVLDTRINSIPSSKALINLI